MLQLDRSITLTSSKGVEIHLTEALVDTRQAKAVPKKPVAVRSANNTLNANELEVVNNGDLIRFIGAVRMKINPTDSGEKAIADRPAQTSRGTFDVPGGFSSSRNQPVQIESTTLEIRDKEHRATFLDDVRLVQGETTLKCSSLIINYDEGGRSDTGGESGPFGQRQIRTIDAKGGIVIIQKDQAAVGDSGTFDMKANTAVLLGKVVLTQGENVVRGDQLTADLNTGLLRIETKKAGQAHVQSVFVRNSGDKSAPDAEKDMRHPMLGQPLPLR